jgi:hypothetical protein
MYRLVQHKIFWKNTSPAEGATVTEPEEVKSYHWGLLDLGSQSEGQLYSQKVAEPDPYDHLADRAWL